MSQISKVFSWSLTWDALFGYHGQHPALDLELVRMPILSLFCIERPKGRFIDNI